jgi:hypothetical protein
MVALALIPMLLSIALLIGTLRVRPGARAVSPHFFPR